MPKNKWMEIIPQPGNNWKPIDMIKENMFHFMINFLFETSYSGRDTIYQGGPSSEYVLKGRAPYRPF
jgi:hypothetical protein